MSILSKIKDLGDAIFNPQPVDDYVANTGQAPANNSLQGSLGSYRQNPTQFQGGQLPIYTKRLSVQRPYFGNIRSQQISFNPRDIFQEGLQIDPGGSAPSYPDMGYEEEEYLPYM